MAKKEKEKQPIVRVSNSNQRIEEIIKDYPEVLKVYPRALFEEQLRKHLLKHKIK